MPYTSPSQLSPTASYPTTPILSRNGFYTGVSGTSANSGPPRSTTYMHRHRRAPSLSKAISFATPRPVIKLDCHLPGLELEASTDSRDQSAVRPSPSLHQSPPPVSDSPIPAGAIISPPDSTQNSSDDEAVDKSREEQKKHLENIAKLQEAVRTIEQPREGSPDRKADSEWREPDEEKIKTTFQPINSSAFESPTRCQPPSSTLQGLPKEARYTPSKYSIDTPTRLSKKAESPDSSDIDDDAYRLTRKPTMVRRKSGELVKPALRPSSSRRPSSMPGTPTYSKAVHFDSHLEHIRHFLQVDKPLAVSAGSSPIEAYDSDSEFPFANDDFHLRSPPFEWEIVLPNFPRETIERKLMPVRVERVFLSSNNKTLIGTIACANLAYSKHVVARFTLDFWKTTSEVIAEYSNDVRRKQRDDGYDRFNFSIKLEDQANLEKKTLFFCVRYNVKGKEFWDNNGTFNYQVDFRKKAKSQNGKNGIQGASSRAFSRSRPSPPVSSGRPVSLPASFDDFVDSLDPKYGFPGFKRQASPRAIGDSSSSTPLLKNPKPTSGVARDPQTHRSGQAFGNRYDFEASLSAAIQATNRQADDEGAARVPDQAEPMPRPASSGKSVERQSSIRADNASSSASYTTEKPAIQSNHYNEILNKYCFYGSTKPSRSTRPRPPMVDGPADDISTSSYPLGGSGTSTSASPPTPLDNSPLTSEPRSDNPRLVRPSSPTAMANSYQGSRTPSPASYVYPYHTRRHGFTTGFPFNEGHAPPAINC